MNDRPPHAGEIFCHDRGESFRLILAHHPPQIFRIHAGHAADQRVHLRLRIPDDIIVLNTLIESSFLRAVITLVAACEVKPPQRQSGNV